MMMIGIDNNNCMNVLQKSGSFMGVHKANNCYN